MKGCYKLQNKAFRKTDASDAQKLIDDPKLLEEWKAKQTPAPQKNLPVTEKGRNLQKICIKET